MAVIDDKFSGEGSDVDLASHTPDTTGTGWTNVETTGVESIEVSTVASPVDVARATGAEADDRTLYSAQGTYPSNDYDVEAVMDNIQFGAATLFWLLGRLTDASNYYAAGFAAVGGNDVQLRKKVAGNVGDLGSADSDFVANDTAKLKIRDATKRVFINDTEFICSGDDALTSIGEAGIGFGNIKLSTDNIGATWDIDNFLVTDAGAAATPKGPFGMPFHGPFGGPV